MAGGETSLSGNDDSSLPLAYTPGYEQLYINGVLQVRGGDYTATTGTTVTGLTALVANDVVEIFSAVARTVADVYTQTQIDSKLGASGWTTYTPTLGGITLGNGTLSANYIQLGKTIHLRFKLTLGSTSAITGDTTISLPVAAKSGTNDMIGHFFSNPAGTLIMGYSTIFNNILYLRHMVANTTYVTSAISSSTTPATWATGNILSASITYEAA
jgi:hypothetical protein